MSSSPPSPNPFQTRLSASESSALGAELAAITASGVPLASGLRAAAADIQSRRLAATLRTLADELERGKPLSELVGDGGLRAPQHFLALLGAGLRSGSVGRALQDFIEFRSASDDRWRMVRVALAYPSIVLTLSILIFVFFLLWLVPPMTAVFREFHIDLPSSTRTLIWFSEQGIVWIGLGLLALLIPLAIVRVLSGAWLTQALLSGVPFLGAMLRLGNWTQFSHLLAVLLEHQVPLPEALRLTAAVLPHDFLAFECRELARRTGEGMPLSQGLQGLRQFSPTLIPMVRWGESTGSVSAALGAAAEMFAARAEVQGRLMRIVVGPATFLVIATLMSSMLIALTLPLVKLITALT